MCERKREKILGTRHRLPHHHGQIGRHLCIFLLGLARSFSERFFFPTSFIKFYVNWLAVKKQKKKQKTPNKNN